MTRQLVLVGSLCLMMAPLAGCGGGDGPELGYVEGTVTLDGQPLPEAQVEFQPQGEGRPSYGETDAGGRFELQFGVDQPGAMVGTHTVRITTGGMESTGDGPPTIIEEKVPPQYNTETQLEKTVEPGSNEFEFTLTTSG
jgi:hypothetical protein